MCVCVVVVVVFLDFGGVFLFFLGGGGEVHNFLNIQCTVIFILQTLSAIIKVPDSGQEVISTISFVILHLRLKTRHI